jgi:D-3-phosphoglycerate dehydrogenase / 2-oxoglutarate reductase
MRLLVADKLPVWFIDRAKGLGYDLRNEPAAEGDALTALMKDYDPHVIVVRSTKVNAAHMAAAPSLAVVIRAGAGVNTIDVAEATRRNVRVTNCPGKNSSAVAELAIGLLIALDRRIVDNVVDLRNGKWDKKGYGKAKGLRGRTLGVVGMGNIGTEVSNIAMAMGMKIITWDPFLPAERAQSLGVQKTEDLLEVARTADAVSVHLAQVPETVNLVGEAFFSAMKPGALFINTSRAGVVAQDAMEKAIREKGIRLGTDVYAKEPGANDTAFADPIITLPGVYGTHHIGASTDQAQDAVAEEGLRILLLFKAEGQVPNCVNPV